MSIDLHILPIHRREGQDLQDLPGLFVADASITRRAARSRKTDIFILQVSLQGTATLQTDGQAQLLESLARDYFESGGSVTTALRSTVEKLNDFLLSRNREGSNQNLQATGLFAGVVYHKDQIYTVQCGPNHLFTVHSISSRSLHDPYLAGRGLGLSKAVSTYFNHAPLNPGDLIILTNDPPGAWKSSSLQKAYGRPLNTIHRVLMNAAGEDVKAVLIQASPGKGQFKLLKTDDLRSIPAPTSSGAPVRARDPFPEAGLIQEKPERPKNNDPEEKKSTPDPMAVSSLSTPMEGVDPVQEASIDKKNKPGQAVLTVVSAFSSAMKALGFSIRSGLSRVLPGSDLLSIPAATMAFISIAVPILVVTIAGVVYVRRGQVGLYNDNLNKAQEFAAVAVERTDPEEARITWEAVLFHIDKAENYQITEETQVLRNQAYAALDPIEGIERLDFSPMLSTPLGESVNIVKMIATRDELYFLDETSGSVIRAWLTGRGFEIDTQFQCGSFGNNTYSIGRLIDLAPIPQNSDIEADIYAMDGNGNAIYCNADGGPPIAQAIAVPASNWGDPHSFVVNNGVLYVLDPQTNAVWIYRGNDFAYQSPPDLFFGENVPEMNNVIDFTVDLKDLYLLNDDGHLTTCVLGSGGQATKCVDPAIFTETRPGKNSAAFVEDANFSQVRFSPPPDPSIYFLDAVSEAIYQYSLRLTFQRQFRPISPQGESITAFTLSPGRTVFLAYGNEVYGAILP